MNKVSFRNISAAGIIVIMLTIMIIFGGLGFFYLSSLDIDQQNFFEAFNQSVIENRERARRQADFRNLELQDIERTQNNTRDLLPPLLESFNQTDRISLLVQNISDIEEAAEERAQRLVPPFEDMMRNVSILNEKFDMLLNRSSSLSILS